MKTALKKNVKCQEEKSNLKWIMCNSIKRKDNGTTIF